MYKCSADFNTNNSTTVNTTIADNADVIADQATTIGDSHPHYGLTIKKEKYSNFLDHPVLINHLAWAPATLTASVTNDLLALYASSAPAYLLRKLQNLMFFKAKIRIKIVIQGQAQAYGQLVYAFTPVLLTPAGSSEATVAHTLNVRNPVNAKIVPHLVVDPSKTATYELELPIPTPNGVYSFNATLSQGSYALDRYVFNGLRSGTAVAASSNVCMYMSFVEPQFDGLTVTNMVSNIPAKEMKLSHLVNGAVNVSEAVGRNFPILSPFTSLFSGVGSGVSSALSVLGFGRPPTVDNGTYIMNRTCDAYSQVDGISTNIVMGPSQKQGESIAPDYMSGSLVDMEISTIASKRGLIVLDGVISPATAPNTLIKTFRVHPNVSMSPAANTYNVTPLAGISICHAAWRGEIKYTFEFIASVFHRGTVLIAWDPYNASTAPTVQEAIATLETVTVNISGNTCIDVHVPYKQVAPMLRTKRLFVEGDSGSDTNGYNGKIYMYVINPVLSNGSTEGIAYNLYISAPDIKFIGPTPMFLNDYKATMVMSLITQEVSMTKFGESSDGLVGYGFEPDVCTSIKEIMRRHNEYYIPSRVTAPGSSEFVLVAQNTPCPRFYKAGPPIVDTTVKNTFVGWLTAAYLGWRGSLSWSFYANNYKANANTPWVQVGHHIAAPFNPEVQRQVADFLPQEDAYAYSQPNLAVSSRADVIVPRMVGWYFTPTRYRFNNYMDTIQADFRYDDQGLDTEGDIMLAAGDDFVVGWFLGFPQQLTTLP